MTVCAGHQRRALLLGRALKAGQGGGLAIALDDLQETLERRGWIVERPLVSEAGHALLTVDGVGLLGVGFRWAPLTDLQRTIPRRVRRWLIELSRPAAFFERASAHLWEVEAWLQLRRYDVVLACPQGLPPGLLDLATRRHPRVISIGLASLGEELQYSGLWFVQRLLARARVGRCHTSVGRPVSPHALHHAVFASQAWRREAIQEGVPVDRASTIYFGVEVAPRESRQPWRDRLLWVGRLAPEKGLHRLIAALPSMRAQAPELKVTAIAAPGAASYALLINRLLLSSDVQSSLTLLGPRARLALREAYRSHDALVFYSVFDEPVALVTLEAFAAGLPVIASRPSSQEGPVRDGETCLCFDPANPDSLREAVSRLSRDAALRERLCARAREVVEREYSLDAMGDAYAALLG